MATLEFLGGGGGGEEKKMRKRYKNRENLPFSGQLVVPMKTIFVIHLSNNVNKCSLLHLRKFLHRYKLFW